MDISAQCIRDINLKRQLCTRLNLIESDISPRSCVMTTSDQNYVLHLYPQSVHLREGKPRVDVPDNPFAEMILTDGVLTLSSNGKRQYGAILLCA